MRKLLHFFVTLLFALVFISPGLVLAVLAEDEPIDISDKFVDANFKAAVCAASGKTTEEPIYITDVAGITQLNISEKNISSLAGIEYLTALTSLNCTGNNLRSIDLSKNTALKTLDAQACGLLSIDVTKNTALEKLLLGNGPNYQAASIGSDNQFASIDLSKNTALNTLDLVHTWLAMLDLSKNTKLESLYLSDANLSYLDISKNVALKNLDISNNSGRARGNLASLNISTNAALEFLDCRGQQIISLDASKNTKLTHLYCDSGKLTALDVSGCTALKELNCSDNYLTSLDVSKSTKLVTLYCDSNELTSLNVDGCVALKYLYCNNNKLTALDLSNMAALKILDCSYNLMPLEPVGLENLNFDDYTFLPQNVAQAVDIADQITDQNFKAAVYEILGKEPGSPIYDIDVAGITSLDVSGREIASLAGIEYFTGLEALNCSNNLLTELDLSHNVNLRELDCSHNLMLQPPTGIDTSKLNQYVFDPQDVKKPISVIYFIIGGVVLLCLAGGVVLWVLTQKKKKKPAQKRMLKSVPDDSIKETAMLETSLPETSEADLTSVFEPVSPKPMPDFAPEANPVADPFIARFQQSVSQKIKEAESTSNEGMTREIK